MLPVTENVDELLLDFEETQLENTKTFSINTKENTVGGMIDGVAALQQNIYLMLNTEADQYIIYPYTYGLKTVDLIGKPYYYVEAVLQERIRETLFTDDRILDVSDFEFNTDKNKLHVKFLVTTIYGNFDDETVVTY